MTNIYDRFSGASAFCKRISILSLLAVIFSIFFIAAVPAKSSAESQSQPVFKVVPVSERPFFEDDLDFGQLEEAISGSIAYYQKLPAAKQFFFGKDTFSAGHLIRSLKRFQAFIKRKPSQKELSAFIDQHYHVYAHMKNGAAKPVLFTGYYEPLLHGSLNQTEAFRYPVYQRPGDLVTLDLSDFSDGCSEKMVIGRNDGNTIVPYYSRQQIEAMAIPGISALPIAWVNDPVDLFFLQIQGSGKIRLENGTMINVHYQISNGHPYKSIGKYLIDKKKLSKEKVSMQSIREYLNAHPDEVDEIFNYNPRYIFFETVEKGPIGCFNIELTPGRSVALDRQTAPAGALVFIQAEKPKVNTSDKIQAWVRFSRFLLNQDTGSAIKGSGRADIFWGSGTYAELAAGYMKHPGQLYFLVLKPDEMVESCR
ncbi:MAG: murein transglycosylase [Desulfobacteraceae bacterium]|nr:MltA domain-containing protein [Desulfobacteraceae bacterium]MBC2757630.1 murein transglycosylase [Desulfobacteraceae bacterium]